MFRTATNDGVKDRPLTMADGIDLDNVTLGPGPIILRKLPKGPLGGLFVF